MGTQSRLLLTKGVECLATLALFSHSCLYTISLCPHTPRLPLKHQQLLFAGWSFLGLELYSVLGQLLYWSRTTFPSPPWVLHTDLSLKSPGHVLVMVRL